MTKAGGGGEQRWRLGERAGAVGQRGSRRTRSYRLFNPTSSTDAFDQFGAQLLLAQYGIAQQHFLMSE